MNKEITRREQEVLHLIANEKTSKEIASDLFISMQTVHSHRKNIMTKWNVKNTAGLVRVGFEKGVLGNPTLPSDQSNKFKTMDKKLNPYIINMGQSCWTIIILLLSSLNLSAQTSTCLHFDGFNDYVQVPSPLTGNAEFTIEMWLKPESTSEGTCSNTNAENFDWLISWDDDDFGIGDCDGNLSIVYKPLCPFGFGLCSSLPAFNTTYGQWTHIAITRSTTEIRVYINGNFHVNFGAGTYDFGGFYRIGLSGTGSVGNPWRGCVEELRIWDFVKTETQVQENLSCFIDGSEAGLLQYFSFNDGIAGGNNTSLTMLNDDSGNDNHGTLNGFTLTGGASNFLDCIPAGGSCTCSVNFFTSQDDCGNVNFSNFSVGDNLSYAWDFGDDNGSDLEDPSHTYTESGIYTVCLSVTNGVDCEGIICKDVVIIIDNDPPNVYAPDLEIEIPIGFDGEIVNFSHITDDPLATVVCVPPSGSTFPIGTTTVACTATDVCGNTSETSFTVTVVLEDLNNGDDGQQDGDASPDGVLEDVYDRMGNAYRLPDVAISARSGQILCVNSGYFNLYFEPGCGMEGNTTAEIARRDVLCQLFNDLSNFITPANNLIDVNIWIRDINNIPGTGPNVLGLASSFYILPSNNNTIGGILDNQIWKTINSGVDAYAGFTNPLTSTGTGSTGNGSYFHGMMAFNFNNFSWHTDLPTMTSAGLYDLYTVGLHEGTHALGFASLIDDTGLSRFTSFPNYYSRYDLSLQTLTGDSLIVGTGTCPMMYDYQFNPALPLTVLQPNANNCQSNNTSCIDAIRFVGSLSPPQAVYTPNCWEAGSSLSHLEDLCHNPNSYPNDEYYVMSNANGTGSTFMKRYLKEEERQVLCDLGYYVNLSYGNQGHFTDNTYTGASCKGIGVAGVNDGITSSATFAYVTTLGTPITITDILQNDYNAVSFTCLETVQGSDNPSVSSGTSFTYPASSGSGSETVLLRYVPVDANGTKGNITYVIIRINGACPADPCNMILNPGFELGSGCGWTNVADCWTQLAGSADIFERGCGSSIHDIPTDPYITNIPADTWDNSLANTRFAGMVGYTDFNWVEALQVQLSTPIMPGSSYIFSCYAKAADNGDGYWTSGSDQNISLGGSVNLLAPLSSISNSAFTNSFPGRIPLGTPAVVTDDGQWHQYFISFTYNGIVPLNYLNIANHPILVHGVYFMIDDVSLTLDEQISFSPPSPLCIDDAPLDLTLYATPPGGTFSGTGVSGTLFDPAVAGIGVHNIIYDYTNNLGCPSQTYSNIQVIADVDCPDCCDQNQIIVTQITPPDSTLGVCCFDLTIENFCMDEFIALDLCLSDGQFSNQSMATGWTIFPQSSQKVSILPTSTYIPDGTPVSIGTLCIDQYSSPTQTIDVIYQDVNYNDTDCRHQIDLMCPIDTIPDLCLNIVNDTMICDNNIYTYTFYIENFNPNFCIEYVQLFTDAGYTVTPSSIVLGTPLCVNDPPAGPFSVVVGGPNAQVGNNFCLELEGHDTNINITPSTNCCRDFSRFCTILPDCCDCEEDIVLVAIPKGNMITDCCYQLAINNDYCKQIKKIEVSLTTPGVTFGQITGVNGWFFNKLNGDTTLMYEPFPPGGCAPTGSFLLPEFCLDDAQATQNIIVKYHGLDDTGAPTVFCEETIPLTCPPPPVCDSLINMSMACRADGDYDFSFQLVNNSNFTAGLLELSPNSLPCLTIPPITVNVPANGGISPLITIILPGNCVSSVSQLCLQAQIWEIVNGQQGDCCTNSSMFCVPVPTCPNCNALSFDGTNDYITIANNPLAGNVPNFTIEGWFRSQAPNSGAYNRILGFGGTRLEIGERNGQLSLFIGTAETQALGAIVNNMWHHFAIVRNGTSFTLYLDFNIVHTRNNYTTNFTNFRIGRWPGGTIADTWLGELDEFRIWNTSRTLAQINSTDSCAVNPLTDPSLIAYYDFNQGLPSGNNSGITQLTDQAGGNNNGTLQNFALNGTTSNWITGYQPVCTPCPACTCGDWTHSLVDIGGTIMTGSPCGQTYTLTTGETVDIQQSFSCIGNNCTASYIWTYPNTTSTTPLATADLNQTFSIPGTYCYTIVPQCDSLRCTPCTTCFDVQPACTCGNWNYLEVLDPVTGLATPVACGDAFPLTCNPNYTYSLVGEFLCHPHPTCPAIYNYTIYDANGVFAQGTANGLINIPLNFTVSGVYNLVIDPLCGGTNCGACEIVFDVDCDERCCRDRDFRAMKITQDGHTYNFMGCGDQVTIGCVTTNSVINFEGIFNCPSPCMTGGLSMSLTNITDPNSNNHFAIPVGPNLTFPAFSESLPVGSLTPGIYEIYLQGFCTDSNNHGTKCTCTYTFEVPVCGCPCGPGQPTLQIEHAWVLGCKKCIKVSGLRDCDIVEWSYREAGNINFQPFGSDTQGNTKKCVPNGLFPWGTNTTIEVRAIVSRIDMNGDLCQTNTITTIPKLTIYCPAPSTGDVGVIANGGVTGDISTGVLDIDGSVDGWYRVQGLPFVYDEMGCSDNGYLTLQDDRETQDVVVTPVNIEAGKTYRLQFCFRTPLENTSELSPMSTKYSFNASIDLPTDEQCQEGCKSIGTTESLRSFEWDTYQLPKWTATDNCNYVAISVLAAPSNPEDVTTHANGWIDNIELVEVAFDECDAENIYIGSVPEVEDPLLYHARNNIESTVNLPAGKNLTFKAGNAIDMLSLHEVGLTAEYLAETEDCTTPPESLRGPSTEAESSLRVLSDPNNKTVSVIFQLDKASRIDLRLLDKHGFLQRKLSDQTKYQAGERVFKIDKTGLTPGVYFVKLVVGKKDIVRRIIIEK